jgi:predicted  nucleic acid-binding Zn-ribbon protein
MAEIEKELTEKEKKILEESLSGKREEVLRVWEEIKEVFTNIARTFVAWFKAFRKKVDEEAAAGNPNAQYVKYSLEVGQWQANLKKVESKLKVTKQTNARRKLLQEKKYVEDQLAYYEQLQIEALEKMNPND